MIKKVLFVSVASVDSATVAGAVWLRSTAHIQQRAKTSSWLPGAPGLLTLSHSLPDAPSSTLTNFSDFSWFLQWANLFPTQLLFLLPGTTFPSVPLAKLLSLDLVLNDISRKLPGCLPAIKVFQFFNRFSPKLSFYLSSPNWTLCLMGLEWVFLLAYFFFSNQQSWLLILEDILCGGSMLSSSDLKTLRILSVCIYIWSVREIQWLHEACSRQCKHGCGAVPLGSA